MRRPALAPSVLAATLALAACSRTEVATRGPGDGFSTRQGLLLRDGVPFSGIAMDTFPGGTTRAREAYARGLRHGTSLAFYENGGVRWKREFRQGMKEGLHEGWWDNGARQFEFRFRKGAYEGEAREWYRDGQPAKTMHYAHGEEDGMQRAWRENGTVYANYEARGGRQYGIVNARLCYTVRDGDGGFRSME